jgi:hypothetical protein
MNLSRISKKVPHVDHRQTLPSLHEEKMREFAHERATLPDKERMLKQLIDQYNSDSCNVNRHDLYDKVEKLQICVRKLRNNEYETEYLIKAAPYLENYYKETMKNTTVTVKVEPSDGSDNELEEPSKPVYNKSKTFNLSSFIKQEEKSSKGKLYNEFKNTLAGVKYTEKNNLSCLDCSCGGSRLYNQRTAEASCVECGSVENYIDEYTHNEFRPEVEILSPFALMFCLALKSTMHYIFRHCVMETIKISSITC